MLYYCHTKQEKALKIPILGDFFKDYPKK